MVEKKINLLIIGKNKDWKHESSIGSKNNRRAYNLPHSKLIELLKYKYLLNNILLIKQEESYTSKTSFACNEKLKEYGKENKTELIKASQFLSLKRAVFEKGRNYTQSGKGINFYYAMQM